MNGPDYAAGPTLRNRGQLETIPEDSEFIPWWWIIKGRNTF